jgi:hypothetical protein
MSFIELQPLMKTIEIELRSEGKLSKHAWEQLTEISDWQHKIIKGFIEEVNLRINQGSMDFVYPRYNVEQPYKNKIKKDLLIVALKRDQQDTVLTDIKNRLVIPKDLSYESMEIWGMPVEQARNFAAEKALEFGCQLLCFIDDDEIIENTTLIKLLETMNQTGRLAVGADYQKKADYPISAHGKFYDTEFGEHVKEVDLLAMGATLLNIHEITKQVPFPLFWTFPAPDGLWSMGEDAFFTKNFIDYTGEYPLVDLRPSVLHYDKTWKRVFGERDKTVTYATQGIDTFDQFERLRVPPSFPIVNICIPKREENDLIATNFNKLLNLRGYRNEFTEIHGQQVDVARNELAINSVKLGSEFTFFIDNDIILPQNALVKMLEVMEEDENHEIGAVTGDYLLKGNGAPHSAFLQLDERGMVTELNRISDLPEVVDSNWLIGLGCCLIRTEVFRQIRYPWFSCFSKNHAAKGVYEGEEGGVNEDAFASELMFENGYKIKILRDLKCLHVDYENRKMFGYEKELHPEKFAVQDWINSFEYVSEKEGYDQYW